MSSSGTAEIVQQGWLTKSPPAKGLFRPRWRRRWFILRNGSFPNQFVLDYFTDESCRRQKGQINLDECEQLDLSSNPQIAAPLSVQDRHKFTFNLRTPSRVYYLAADTETEMNNWVTSLCHVCGLKTVEDETETYTKPMDENNLPESTYNRDSDESSPSLSTHTTGPYIPISQCHTGKPVYDNNESRYCNTSFPFPPKVNWATHPAKKEGLDNDPGNSPSEMPALNAPPRPPKKSSSAVTGSLNSPSPGDPPKTVVPQQSNARTVFPYDSMDDTHDSSSTCSSLHSPPGSAGVVYSNIPDMSPVHPNSNNNSINSQAFGSDGGGPEFLPPKVDRNLKPDLRRPLESPSYKSCQQSPTAKFPNGKHCSRAMTLPSKSSQRGYPTGPSSRKTHDNPIMLGPTPAQIKTQGGVASMRYHTQESNTSTLPSRRIGPALSSSEKKPFKVHEYEAAPELTYTQLDYKVDSKPAPLKHSHKRSQSTSQADEAGAVEYRLIDHIKTQALNQTMQDREVQLRLFNTNKNLK